MPKKAQRSVSGSKPSQSTKQVTSKQVTNSQAKQLKVSSKTAALNTVIPEAATGTRQLRRLQLPKRSTFKRATWRRNLPVPIRTPIARSRLLMLEVTRLVFSHWKLFGGIVVIYGLLDLLLVRGFSGSANLTTIKSSLDGFFNGSGSEIKTALLSFVVLLGSSGSGTTAGASAYQYILLIICSLAFIWALRQTVAGHTPRIRDSFYLGMYPLIPFMLVLFALCLRLIPLVIGTYLYSLALGAGVLTNSTEKIFVGIICLVPVIWSLRMLTSATFALYIVTLPNMTPRKALRSAKELVYKRRLVIWRKIILLPVVLVLIAAVIELPLILWWSAGAEWVFFALSMGAIVVVHAYLYGLYRELL